jgi:ABC-type nitrate/sulfonate/bicarbonate transport system substrate-binding protein
MPKVAEGMGMYRANGLNVDLRTVAWEDIVPSLASAGQTIDVGIGSINLLLPKAENIDVKGHGDVVFYYPLYVFKGAAILMHKESRIRPLSDFIRLYPSDRNRAIREAMLQLKGMSIAVPQGTPYEQMLLAALKVAGMNPKTDIDLRYVKLADSLPAFLQGGVDLVGAGVTQRTEAARHGHRVFMDMESLGFAEVIGLVTTNHFAQAHPAEMQKLVRIWFDSVDKLMSDIDGNSKYVLSYLDKTASTKYSLKEYKAALTFQEFPRSIQDDEKLMFDPAGRFYWKRTWDIVDDYLVSTKASSAPIPYSYFLGDSVDKQLGSAGH